MTKGQVAETPQPQGKRGLLGFFSTITAFFGVVFGGFFRGVGYWKETSIVLPLAILLFALICFGILMATGRQLLNDLGDLVDDMKNVLRLLVMFSIIAAIQKACHGYRSEEGVAKKKDKEGNSLPVPIEDDLYDVGVWGSILVPCMWVMFLGTERGLWIFLSLPIFWLPFIAYKRK